MPESLVPVTLLTGFLGAGKTTLLNHILRISPERIAVIENEFGPVNIDGGLIQSAGEVVEITNGCLCCTVLDNLATSLKSLWQKKNRGDIIFSRLIIETTGLADPGPVLQTFFADSDLANIYMLDGVITVVDARHYENANTLSPVLQKQIAHADRLIISKADLVDRHSYDQLLAKMVMINPRATLIKADHGQVTLEEIFDIHGFMLDDQWLDERLSAVITNQPAHSHDSAKKLHDDHDISAHLLEHAGEVDLDKISAFMQQLIDDFGDRLIRYKGILALPNEPRKLIFQGVQRVAGFDYGNPWPLHDLQIPRSVKIVLIGFDLPFAQIQRDFQQCCL